MWNSRLCCVVLEGKVANLVRGVLESIKYMSRVVGVPNEDQNKRFDKSRSEICMAQYWITSV